MGVKSAAFKSNDKAKVQQQIQGMHGAVATLTKQPVFLLTDAEGKALSSALCDVLDYHEINLTEAGGVGGLYLALALTVFGIYKPRLDYIKNAGGPQIERATAPDTVRPPANNGRMDFGGDIEATLN